MIFKDRQDAAEKLFTALQQDPLLSKKSGVIVASLLRGGVVLGDVLAKKLKAKHLPLVVTKVSAPDNEELAIGALVFDVVYLEKRVIDSLLLLKPNIREQISQARTKFDGYVKTFGLKEDDYGMFKGKTVVLVDDGIATGATMKTAVLFVKEKGARAVIVASPVASEEFNFEGIDSSIVLVKDPFFSAVSQFYAQFPQIPDSEVKKILKK